MRNKKILEFILLLIAVILTRLADVAGTYHYTPDLAFEANPMVCAFGFGWQYLIAVQIAGTLFSAGINYLSLFLVERQTVAVKNLHFKDFISQLYFGEVTAWNWQIIVLSNPQGKHQALYMYGWLIPRIIIYAGVVLVVFHLLLAFVPAYHQVHKYFVLPMYILILSGIPVCLYSYYRFRFNEYKKTECYGIKNNFTFH